MENIKKKWRGKVLKALEALAQKENRDSSGFKAQLILEKPPQSAMGDLSFPLFPFAKIFKKSPLVLAKQLLDSLSSENGLSLSGAYLNIRIDRLEAIEEMLSALASSDSLWGNGETLRGRKIMLEFSSPNTNKPLHLGHLRNDILGESCARLLMAQGAEVKKVNLVNDRGIHICKSMLAYNHFAKGATPESAGIKSDRFVGNFYVQFNQWAEENDEAEVMAQQMLQQWEEGDQEIRGLWKKMNSWALEGIAATYKRTGVSFDRVYYESDTYLLGKEQVLKGLKKNIFFRHKDGSIRLDMNEIGLDDKVLLRSDGTAVYITQDLGTAINRHKDWPFDQLIYVVGNEQEYHFKVLFHAIDKLGFPWSKQLEHLSYGMVNLVGGKMKSREGFVVDADDLIDTLANLALETIQEKGREEVVGDSGSTAEKIALAALHYFLLQVSPKKDMIFNPKESLALTGNTGPYLQYVVARIVGLKKKASKAVHQARPSAQLLVRDDEWKIARRLAEFPEDVARAAAQLDPSLLATVLYEIARDFSRYYHEVPIVMTENPELAASRLLLAQAVLKTLKKGFFLLNIPYIEIM